MCIRDRTYPLHAGLTAMQMAEGARSHARFFAFMLAEAPAQEVAHLETKIAVHTDMASDPDEIRRSRTAWMVEAALQHEAAARSTADVRSRPHPGKPGRTVAPLTYGRTTMFLSLIHI